MGNATDLEQDFRDAAERVLKPREDGAEAEYLAGLVYVSRKAKEGGAQAAEITGVCIGEDVAYIAVLLANITADFAVRHYTDAPRFCGKFADTVLAMTREKLAEARKSAGGVILPDSKIAGAGGAAK